MVVGQRRIEQRKEREAMEGIDGFSDQNEK